MNFDMKNWIKDKEIYLLVFGIIAAVLGGMSGIPGIIAVVIGVGIAIYAFWAYINKKIQAEKFEVVESFSFASQNSNLTDLEWDRENFLLVATLNELNALYKLNGEYEPNQFIQPGEGWFWKVCFNKNIFVIRIFQGKDYEILEFGSAGELLNSFKPIIQEDEHPSSLIFDGKNFWIGFDVSNRVYKLSGNFEVITRFDTFHRILCATFAKNHLWFSDAETIYQYDLDFNFVEKFTYPIEKGSCRGLAFDNEFMWSLANTPKKLLKHKF